MKVNNLHPWATLMSFSCLSLLVPKQQQFIQFCIFHSVHYNSVLYFSFRALQFSFVFFIPCITIHFCIFHSVHYNSVLYFSFRALQFSFVFFIPCITIQFCIFHSVHYNSVLYFSFRALQFSFHNFLANKCTQLSLDSQ